MRVTSDEIVRKFKMLKKEYNEIGAVKNLVAWIMKYNILNSDVTLTTKEFEAKGY